MSHDRLLHQYIRSSKSPDGQYHVNVPSGLAVVENQVKNSNTGRFDKDAFVNYAANRAKEIDAVCVTTQPTYKDVPWENLNHGKGKYIDTGIFDGERVILIEAKTKSSEIFKGIGQLKAYSTHFREYWDAENVEELLVLLGEEADEYTQAVHEQLPVRFVDIEDISSL